MPKTIQKILSEFKPKKNNLLPALKKIGAAFNYINEEQAQKIAGYFSLPLSQVFETGSFYDEIKFEKSEGILIEICSGFSCAVNNSLSLISEIENHFKIRLNNNSGSKVKLRTMSCLGRCAKGPIMKINGEIYEQVSKNTLREILREKGL